jgi:S-adenosylmethionine:tRNA ribosyltransferase-isomerase
MDVRDFQFAFDPELIAQEPVTERTAARLLRLSRYTGSIQHATISELPGLLEAGDLLVVNDTRVMPARLLGRRTPSGGAVECLLVACLDARDGSADPVRPTEEATEVRWEALMHPGQKLKPGSQVIFEDNALRLHGEVLARRWFGRREIRLWTEDGTPVNQAIERVGHVPLPPYIRRRDTADDRTRYQTMFADRNGSIAAPTAGLHFTPPLVENLRARGVFIVSITLHVGYGTFQPVRVTRVEEHHVERERYHIGPAAADAINRALSEDRRIVAVGTTTTRALESAARESDGRVRPGAAVTDLFIFPGFEFRVIRGLLTNFHLPQSSLLMLVSAFAGRERVLAAYKEAVTRRYRFYSYGDAMLIL